MKKNILTIIILAISLINTALIAVMIFTIVPAASNTNRMVDKVMSIIDLELENPDGSSNVNVKDIAYYDFENTIQCSLVSNDDVDHYLKVDITLSENKKNEDYADFPEEVVKENEKAMSGIISNVFSQYTKEEVKKQTTQEQIKKEILTQIHKLFNSDFIINITFNNLLVQ
jgi:flagellar basal body-associated protein FliL